MNKLCKIARALDVFFAIAFWACVVFGAAFLVIGVALPFIPTGAEALTYAKDGIQFEYAGIGTAEYFANVALSVAGFALTALAIRVIRQILAPMKDGQPFAPGTAQCFSALGIFTIAFGIVGNIASLVTQRMFFTVLDEAGGTDAIVSVSPSIDFTFIPVAAILFLCSYIFRYGAELQTQADETL